MLCLIVQLLNSEPEDRWTHAHIHIPYQHLAIVRQWRCEDEPNSVNCPKC
uniref:Uncharacterized protein n=1 Tax=Anguilla anguilla TaxID=7936 RepID=A0A0E9PQ32_ANGAN